jgi:hypothetical protein
MRAGRADDLNALLPRHPAVPAWGMSLAAPRYLVELR